MGMYTEIVFKASVDCASDQVAYIVLKYLFSDGDKPDKLPEHEFFTKPRWDFIGKCSSCYHHPQVLNGWEDSFVNPRGAYIFSRSDIKNYNGEIEAFFDWVQPYVSEVSGKCVGYSWYEGEISPTLEYKKGKSNE